MKGNRIAYLTTVTVFLHIITVTIVCSQRRTIPSRASRLFPITGNIKLDGLAVTAPAQRVTLYIDLSDRIYVTTTYVRADGMARIYLPSGQHTAVLRADKWLSRRITISTGISPAEVRTVLPGGDANGDDTVDWLELDILADAYKSQAGEDHWDSRADFDCDGDVDDDDANILFDNFGQQGEG